LGEGKGGEYEDPSSCTGEKYKKRRQHLSFEDKTSGVETKGVFASTTHSFQNEDGRC